MPGYSESAIVEEGEFSEGRKIGMWKAYFPSGKLKSEITHDNGRPKGPYTTYYENGQIEERGNWENKPATMKMVRFNKISLLTILEKEMVLRSIIMTMVN